MTKEELYEKYRLLIFKVMRDLHCNIKDSQERQSYFEAGEMGLLKAIKNYDVSKRSTTGFIYSCIRNEILRYFTEKTSPKRYLDNANMLPCDEYEEVIEDININIEKDLLIKETNKDLYKAIDMLKPKYKDIIVKKYGIKCHEIRHTDLAKYYNISSQALYQQTVLALKKLRKNLKEIGWKIND